MNWRAAFDAALMPLRGANADCRGCGHFSDDPQRVEAALPGLSALASTHSSVWAESGLCLLHDRVINGRRRCPAFVTCEHD